MARVYEVLFDYGEFPNQSGANNQFVPDSLTTSPYAIMAVYRYRYPVTFSRSQGGSFAQGGSATDAAVKLRELTLIVCDDIQNLQVNFAKTNHVSQLQATLLPGMNYLTEMFPGDWVMCWMVNDKRTLTSLIDRIKKNQPCNKFYDGLKFVGKVASVRKSIVQSPTGIRHSTYTINAAGFTEFDAQLYFEPYLAATNPNIATAWLKQTGLDIDQLISSSGQGISINKVLPAFMEAFFGKGIPSNSASGSSTAGMPNNQTGITANSFIVPAPVGKALGVSQGSKPNGQVGWNDICEVLQGIQKYQLSNGTLQSSVVVDLQNGKPGASGRSIGDIFTPDGVPDGSRLRRRETKDPMLGVFLPSSPQFTGQRTVWSVMQQYLNPTVNEMYTCLRVNPAGDVLPTLVVRQLPFSSGLISDLYRPKDYLVGTEVQSNLSDSHRLNKASIDSLDATTSSSQPRQLTLTRFMELPRWRIHPILIQAVDLGRSDALRFNFVHVYGETGLQSQNKTGYIIRDPPISDDIDISRSGLRPYMQSVNCAPADTLNRKAGDWMYIISDMIMGQHLMLTGTMSLKGIQSPICPGDNVEFDGHVLHIESVTHSFQMSNDGKKHFSTNLSLTHGVKVDQDDPTNDAALFSGTKSTDLTRFDAFPASEYSFSPNKITDPAASASQDTSKPAETSGAGDYESTDDGSNGSTA